MDLRYVADRFAPTRSVAEDGRKTYSLWDAYPLADLVAYPSEIEGFGNAFLEASYFKRPIFVNRYPVYVSDLAAAGFKCVEMDGVLTDDVVRDVADLLEAPSRVSQWVERNYQVALERFSYEAVTPTLEKALARVANGSS